MVWRITTTNEPQFRPSVDLHSEDEALYREMKNTLKREQGLWGMTNIGIMNGFAYPVPDRPIRLRVASNGSQLPTFLAARITWAVTRPVIDAIEELEPGTHRYWPTEITLAGGGQAEPRWLLNICSRLETLSIEDSDVMVMSPGQPFWTLAPNFSEIAVSNRAEGKKHLVCRRDRIGDHAIWCEYRYINSIFISNDLAEKFRSVGADGLLFDLESAEI